ncbi:MAG: YdbH domain-containing protein, partial [Desulfobulbaceae bacterium]|nr:YdbH domain-containing protein [Desulfobulbaceae bacterium]
GPSFCQPLRVALKGGAGRGSSLHGASRLDIEIQKDGEGVSPALFQLLVETTADLGEFFKKAERGETLPLSMSALLDLPPVDTLMNRVPETLSPLPIQASLSGQGTVRFRGGQWQSHGQWQGNVVGGPVRGDMAVTTELAFGAGGGRIEVAGSGKAPPLAVTVRDLLLDEALVSGAVALAEDEDHRLLVASWEGKSLSLQSEAKVRLDEPLLVAFPAEPLRRLELSGNMQLAGQLQGGVVRLTSKPKVRLVGQNGETTATLGLAGELVGAGGGDVEDFVWRLGGTGLEFVVDGHGPRGRLLQPARFRLENGNDAGLLRLRSGVPSFSGRLSSLGPRLDLAVGDNRFVVKNDALSLAVKGEGGRAMAVELAVRELLAPEQFIVAEGLRFVLVFDTARGLIDKMDLMLDRLHDATEVRRFADCNFWAQLRGKGNRLVGDGAFAIHNSDSDPLAWPLHFDLAGDGRSGRVVLAANDFSLAPGSINLKNLFPVVAGAVNSVVASCDVRGELSWDAARGEGVIDSRLKVSDFDIDLAPPELPGEKLRLIGGDIVIFFKAPVSALSTGRLVTHVDAVTLITPQFALFGVQGLDLHAEPVWPLYTPEPLVITFDELSGFLPFDDGKLSFAVTNGREIALREMGMHLAGGMVSALPMTIDLANPKGELRLAVHGVQLAELREKLQISLKDHLQVTGELDGVLPIEFSSDGIRLQGAVLEAKRPGLLRYRPGDAQDWRYKTGKSTLQVALSDLRYDSFRLALSGDLGEAVTVDLHTEGTNPELVGGMPIDLTLKIHAELEKLLSAYNSSVGGTERSYAVVE